MRTSRWGRIMRLKLVDSSGRSYLSRWGYELPGNRGGVYLHNIGEPDPGQDLHDHPYNFWSVILSGGYDEWVNSKYTAIFDAKQNVRWWKEYDWTGPLNPPRRGKFITRRRWSVHHMDTDHCHRIGGVDDRTWTLVIRGPRKQEWGFYTPDGWVHEDKYSRDRRDLVNAV